MANTTKRRNKGRNSEENIDKRRLVLQEIINHALVNNIHISEKYLMGELEKKDYHITRGTLYFDRIAIAKMNTFVRDMAESSYSQIIEDIYNNIGLIEAEAFQLANMTWQKERVTRTDLPKAKNTKGAAKQSKVEEVERNNFIPKERFLRLALECQTAKTNLLKGDVTNITVAMLSKRLDQYRLQLEEIIKNSTDKDSVHKARMVIENQMA